MKNTVKKCLVVEDRDDATLHCKEVYKVTSNYKGTLLDSFDLCEPVIDGKSFYRYPKLALSRDKVEVLKTNNNISITRNKDKSDYQIISDKYIQSYEGLYSYIIDTAINSLRYMVDGNVVNADDYYEVYVPPNNFGLTRANGYTSYRQHHVLIDKELFECKTLVSDVYMNLQCDKHLNIISEEDFDNLESIIKSDKVLALEMMANSNFEKSKDIIVFLLNKYNNHLYYAKNRNHVSVKSLLNKVGSIQSSWNTYTIASLINGLSKSNGLTKFILKKLYQEWYKIVGTSHVFNGPIKVTQVSVDPEILKTVVNLRDEQQTGLSD